MIPRPGRLLAAASISLLLSIPAFSQTSPAPDARKPSGSPGGTTVAAPENPRPGQGAPLSIHMAYRVISRADPDVKWENASDQIALPGQKVQLKITSANLVVLSELLPQVEGPGSVRLSALSHIWLARGEGQLTYLRSQSSVSVAFGEEVFFYPLGSQLEGWDIVQIGITIQPVAEERK